MNRTPPWQEVRLQLVTPAVVGGARPGEVDAHHPLRVPSIRGCLRHWFRFGVAAQLHVGDEDAGAATVGQRNRGAPLSDDAIRVLRKLEGELFGHVFDEGGDKPRASRLVIRPISDPPAVRVVPQPAQGSGLGYLGYGLFSRDRVTTAVMPGKFSLRLRIERRPDEDDDAYERLRGAVAATIALWATLGGIGARTRRGWGSLELLGFGRLPAEAELGAAAVAVGGLELRGHDVLPWAGASKNIAAPPLGAPAQSRKQRLGWMMDTLDLASLLLRRYVDGHAAYKGSNPDLALADARAANKAAPRRPHTQLRTLAGIESVRFMGGDWPSASAALEAAGRRFMGYRSTLVRSRGGGTPHDDYFEVKDSLTPPFPPPRVVRRAAFGLPLPFFFRSLNGAKAVVNLADTKLGDRMASPLLFRPVQVGEKQWRVALIYLMEAVAPGAPRHLNGGYPLQVGRQRAATPEPDDLLIREFLDLAVRE